MHFENQTQAGIQISTIARASGRKMVAGPPPGVNDVTCSGASPQMCAG